MTMDRRTLLSAAIGGASLTFAAQNAFAEDHSGHSAHLGFPKLAKAARDCVSAGGACLSHCLAIYGMGDGSLADCARTVYQMAAVCEALSRLASAHSEHLKELAKVAQAVCLDCEKQCRKHENKHAECKACAEACAACAEECKQQFA
jgi:Cys-rich four helix bundle protein (predicted Tat secretion target)